MTLIQGFKYKAKRLKGKDKQMKKLMRMVMVLVGVGMMLGFAGCGMVEDSILKSELTKMAKEQLQGHDELMKLWTVEKSSNFTMSPEENGKRTGSFDLELKNKKTGAQQKLAYQFSYNTETDYVEVNVKNPMDALKLLADE